MIIHIDKTDSGFEVGNRSLPGSPPVGRGKTMNDALANWLRCYASQLGVQIEVASSAQPAENARRKRELAKR